MKPTPTRYRLALYSFWLVMVLGPGILATIFAGIKFGIAVSVVAILMGKFEFDAWLALWGIKNSN